MDFEQVRRKLDAWRTKFWTPRIKQECFPSSDGRRNRFGSASLKDLTFFALTQDTSDVIGVGEHRVQKPEDWSGFKTKEVKGWRTVPSLNRAASSSHCGTTEGTSERQRCHLQSLGEKVRFVGDCGLCSIFQLA